jgi:hypothetical protein
MCSVAEYESKVFGLSNGDEEGEEDNKSYIEIVIKQAVTSLGTEATQLAISHS